jgi:manganese/zinc/iron transport system ATP- binding protein
LKAAAGLLPVHAGAIFIYGQPVGACHHRVAYLPQRSQIDWKFPISVRRLVLTGRYVHLGWLRHPGAQDKQIVSTILDKLGLTLLAERQIDQLSGGQQQRALLARALAQEADLLLLDEPLNAVDADTRLVVSGVLAELQQQGKTILVATHDLGQLEKDFDGAIYLQEGREMKPPIGAFVGVRVGQEAL